MSINKKEDPFEKLKDGFVWIVNPKAIFQPYSHESGEFGKKFGREKKLDLLISFVLQGYDLHAVVRYYLENRGALTDACRISEIEDAFEHYYDKIIERYEEGEVALDKSYVSKTGNEYKFYHPKTAEKIIASSKKCSAKKMKKIIEDYEVSFLAEGKKLYDYGDLIDDYKQKIFGETDTKLK